MEEYAVILEKIRDIFNHDMQYHSIDEIIKKVGMPVDARNIKILLDVLEEDGLIFSKNKQYKRFNEKDGYIYGTININKSGTGFITLESGKKILIENNCLNGALDGDTVLVVLDEMRRKDYVNGRVHKILKRKSGNVIYQVVGNGRHVSLIPYNSNEFINVDIKNSDLKNLIDGDIIKVKLSKDAYNGIYSGRVVEVIGNKNDLSTDIKVIASKRDIPVEFSKEIVDEVSKLPKEVSESDCLNRVDLRMDNFITIDCDETKDRDDAVYVKRLSNGNFLIKVSISHVSHYIHPSTKSYDEALKRCFSHYILNYVIPMIHPVVSNGICSLNPNVSRLTKTIEAEIDNNGQILSYNIYDSVIKSRAALSYSKCNRFYEGENVLECERFKDELTTLYDFYKVMLKERDSKHFLDFKLKEIKQVSDEKNNIQGFIKNDQGISGKIIEMLMGIANIVFYTHYSWMILPFRVHEEPDEEKIQEVLSILRKSGYKIPNYKNVDVIALNTIINSLSNDEASLIAREYILRSMKRAKYQTENIGHFATQYDIYGHITSPIRRVADLIASVLVDNYEKMDYSDTSIKNMELSLAKQCEEINKIEKIDEEMEEEGLEMAMAEYMEHCVGEEFEAYIVEIGQHSMFVRTTNNIIGRIRFSDMLDDQYHFDKDKFGVVGRNGNIYHIGNKINVLLKDASKEKRTIDFTIPKTKKLVKQKDFKA